MVFRLGGRRAPPSRAPGRGGFTLIELMVVILVIAIVAALAFPSLLRSRISANEARAIGLLRAYTTAAEQYRTVFNVSPQRFEAFLETPPFIYDPGFDVVVCGCASQGPAPLPVANGSWGCCRLYSGYKYVFYRKDQYPSYGPSAPGYEVYAWPEVLGKTGQRYFFTDDSGVLRAGPIDFSAVPPFTDCGIVVTSGVPSAEAHENLFRALPPLGS